MTRICACRAPLTEPDLFAARTIGVRIEHDAEPCLPTPPIDNRPKTKSFYRQDPRPTLRRLEEKVAR